MRSPITLARERISRRAADVSPLAGAMKRRGAGEEIDSPQPDDVGRFRFERHPKDPGVLLAYEPVGSRLRGAGGGGVPKAYVGVPFDSI